MKSQCSDMKQDPHFYHITLIPYIHISIHIVYVHNIHEHLPRAPHNPTGQLARNNKKGTRAKVLCSTRVGTLWDTWQTG